MLLVSATSAMAQGAKNIRLNEVLTNNTASIVDEFGNREAWIEVENTSFTTYNIRGMYFTTDRSVLDPQMSVPERTLCSTATQILLRESCTSRFPFPCQNLYGSDSTMVMLSN